MSVNAVKQNFLCGVVHKLLKSLGFCIQMETIHFHLSAENPAPSTDCMRRNQNTTFCPVCAETKSRRTIWFGFYLTLRQRFSVYLGQPRGSTREEKKRKFLKRNDCLYRLITNLTLLCPHSPLHESGKGEKLMEIIELKCDSTSNNGFFVRGCLQDAGTRVNILHYS